MRVLVAMSGGVDSAVVAALMVEAGHEVIGATLQLYDNGGTAARRGACCAGRDVHDARRVADRLGIPHYVIDAERRFAETVIGPFADAYARRRNPGAVHTLQPGRQVHRPARPRARARLWRDGDRPLRAPRRGPVPGRSCTARSAPAATRAGSCSRPRPTSSRSCVSRSGASPTRRRSGRSPAASASRWPTSRTARTSASRQAARITP